MKRRLLPCAGVFCVCAILETAGQWTAQKIINGKTVLLPGILNLNRVRNTGVAFSLLQDHPSAAGILSAALLILLFGFILKGRMVLPARCGLSAVLSGGLCNALSRLFTGGVTDWIELAFISFPVFNLADVCICAGAALFAVFYLFDTGGHKA